MPISNLFVAIVAYLTFCYLQILKADVSHHLHFMLDSIKAQLGKAQPRKVFLKISVSVKNI